MSEIKIEAEKILNFFKNNFGMVFEGGQLRDAGEAIGGKEAIDWMINHKKPSTETEWYSYFLRFIAQDYFESNPAEGLIPVNIGKKYRLQGKFLWDIRCHNIDDDARPLVILNDVVGLDTDISNNGGLGIICLYFRAELDQDRAVWNYLQHLKRGPTDYERKRRSQGILPRMLKSAIHLLWGNAFFITLKDLQERSWIYPGFQRGFRNSNDTPRMNKYILDLDAAPKYSEITRFNLNLDPDDYSEYFNSSD